MRTSKSFILFRKCAALVFLQIFQSKKIDCKNFVGDKSGQVCLRKFIKKLKKHVAVKRGKHSMLRIARLLTVGLGWIIFTGGGGTNASKTSVSVSGNTSEDGIHLILCSM